MPDLKVLLISTYELGRQPFGLASPAAWLRADGFHTTSLDLSRQSLDEEAVRTASLIAFYLPMHTATRIAVRALERVRKLNPCRPSVRIWTVRPVQCRPAASFGRRHDPGGRV